MSTVPPLQGLLDDPRYGALQPDQKVDALRAWEKDEIERRNTSGDWDLDSRANFEVETRRARQAALGIEPQSPEEILRGVIEDENDPEAAQVWDALDEVQAAEREQREINRRRVLPWNREDDDAAKLEAIEGRIVAAKSGVAENEIEQARLGAEALQGKRDAAVVRGKLVLNPELYYDRERYVAAVNSSSATPREKARALSGFYRGREETAKAALPKLRGVGAFRSFADTYAAGNPDATNGDVVEAFRKSGAGEMDKWYESISSGFLSAMEGVGYLGFAGAELQKRVGQGISAVGLDSVGNAIQGAATRNQTDILAGLGETNETKEFSSERVQTLGGASTAQQYGQVGGQLFGQVALTMLSGPMSGLGRSVAGAATKKALAAEVGKKLGVGGMAKKWGKETVQTMFSPAGVMAGASSAGPALYESYERNRTKLAAEGLTGPELEEAARGEAFVDATRSALITSTITSLFGLRGVEGVGRLTQVAANPAAREVLKKTVKERWGSVGMGVLSEGAEEALDEGINGGLDALLENPDMTFEDWEKATLFAGSAGALFGGGIEGVTQIAEAAAERVKQSPEMLQRQQKAQELRASGLNQTADALEQANVVAESDAVAAAIDEVEARAVGAVERLDAIDTELVDLAKKPGSEAKMAELEAERDSLNEALMIGRDAMRNYDPVKTANIAVADVVAEGVEPEEARRRVTEVMNARYRTKPVTPQILAAEALTAPAPTDTQQTDEKGILQTEANAQAVTPDETSEVLTSTAPVSPVTPVKAEPTFRAIAGRPAIVDNETGDIRIDEDGTVLLDRGPAVPPIIVSRDPDAVLSTSEFNVTIDEETEADVEQARVLRTTIGGRPTPRPIERPKPSSTFVRDDGSIVTSFSGERGPVAAVTDFVSEGETEAGDLFVTVKDRETGSEFELHGDDALTVAVARRDTTRDTELTEAVTASIPEPALDFDRVLVRMIGPKANLLAVVDRIGTERIVSQQRLDAALDELTALNTEIENENFPEDIRTRLLGVVDDAFNDIATVRARVRQRPEAPADRGTPAPATPLTGGTEETVDRAPTEIAPAGEVTNEPEAAPETPAPVVDAVTDPVASNLNEIGSRLEETTPLADDVVDEVIEPQNLANRISGLVDRADALESEIAENKNWLFQNGKKKTVATKAEAQTRRSGIEQSEKELGGLGEELEALRETDQATKELKPAFAKAVDTYNIPLPEGYVKEGDLYVYRSTKVIEPITLADDVVETAMEATEGNPAARAELMAALTPEQRARFETVVPDNIEGRAVTVSPDGRIRVQSEENRQRAARGERQIGGDRIFDTREEAETETRKEIEIDRQDAEFRARQDAETAAREAAAQAKAAPLKEYLDDAGFKGLSRGRVESTLSAPKNLRNRETGKVYNDTRFNVIQAVINDGGRVEAKAGKKTEFRLYSDQDTFWDINKTEYDAGLWVMAKNEPADDFPVDPVPLDASPTGPANNDAAFTTSGGLQVTFSRKQSKAGTEVEAANEEGRIVGTATFDIKDGVAHPKNVFVGEEFRRKGVASALYRYLITSGAASRISRSEAASQEGIKFRDSLDRNPISYVDVSPENLGMNMSGAVIDKTDPIDVTLQTTQKLQRGFPELFATVTQSIGSISDNARRFFAYGNGIRHSVFEHIGDLYHRAGSETDFRAVPEKVKSYQANFERPGRMRLKDEIEQQFESNFLFNLANSRGVNFDRDFLSQSQRDPEVVSQMDLARSFANLGGLMYSAMYGRLQAFTPLQAAGRNMAIAFGLGDLPTYNKLGSAITRFMDAVEKAGIKDAHKIGFNPAGVNNFRRSNNETRAQFESMKAVMEFITDEEALAAERRIQNQLWDEFSDAIDFPALLLSDLTDQISRGVPLSQRFNPESNSILEAAPRSRPLDLDPAKSESVREHLDSHKLVTDKDVLAALGDYPNYLDEVASFILRQREKWLSGSFTARDVAKAYAITVASQGADAINLSVIQQTFPDFNPGPEFLSTGAKGQLKIRPEEAAAYWFFTPAGQRALDSIEAGEVDLGAWNELSALRKLYGDDRMGNTGVTADETGVSAPIYERNSDKSTKLDEAGNPIPKLDGNGNPQFRRIALNPKTQANLRNIQEIVDTINGAKGGWPTMERALLKFRGIGGAKKAFIGHLLGFGGDITTDAVEINFWITGRGDTSQLGRGKDKSKVQISKERFLNDLAKAVAKDATAVEALSGRIKKSFQRLRKKNPDIANIPEEIFNHIMHHWLWDRAKGIETTHSGMMRAVELAAPQTATSFTEDSDWQDVTNVLLDRAIAKYPKIPVTKDPNIPAPARTLGLRILVNPEELARYTEGMEVADAAEMIEKIFMHEATHRHAVAEVGDNVVVEYANTMTADERTDVAFAYLHRSAYPSDEAYLKAVTDFAAVDPNIPAGERKVRLYRLGHEALRMNVERLTSGYTTEETLAFLQTNPGNLQRFLRYLGAYLRRLKQWFAARKDPAIGVEVKRLARVLKTLTKGETIPRGAAPFDPLAQRRMVSFQGRPVIIEAPATGLEAPAYHGTPHKWAPETLWRLTDGRAEWIIDGDPVPSGSTMVRKAPAGRVRADKVGSGEGAAAYGWGVLYAAENEGVAKEYQRQLSGGEYVPLETLREYFKPGNIVDGYGGKDRVIKFDPGDGNYGWSVTVESVSQQNGEWVATDRPRNHSTYPDVKKVKAAGLKTAIDGALLSLDLKVDQDLLLDWDKPLSEQSEKVRDALSSQMPAGKINPDGLDMGGGAIIRDNRNGQAKPGSSAPWVLVTGTTKFDLSQKDVDRMVGETQKPSGEQIYSRLTSSKGGQKEASDFLRSLGIHGIRYLDGNSRSSGEGTYNYVIFDPDLIEVTGVNGEPVSTEVRDEALGLDAARVAIFSRPKAGQYVEGGWLTAEFRWSREAYRLLEAARGEYSGYMKKAEFFVKDIARLSKDLKVAPEAINKALGNTDNRLTQADLDQVNAIKKRGLAAAQGVYLSARNKAKALDAAGMFADAALARQDAKAQFDLDVQTYQRAAATYEARARKAAAAKAYADRQAAMAALPKPLADVVANLRTEIDLLSARMIAEGDLSAEVQATISNNMELWLHRSYQIFDDPNYVAWINEQKDPEAIRLRNKTITFLRQDLLTRKIGELMAGGMDRTSATAQAKIEVTDDHVADAFDDYLMVADNGSKTLLTGATVSKEVSALMKRGVIPEEIQELWGRYDDPAVNAAKSIGAIAQHLAIHKFYQDLVKLGVQEQWLKPADADIKRDAQGNRLVELLPNNGMAGRYGNKPKSQYAPLAGYLGPEALRDALAQMVDDRAGHRFIQFFTQLTGYSMASKTVLSWQSGMRNFWGNVLPSMINGNVSFDPRTWGRYKDATEGSLFAQLFGRGSDQTRDYVERATALGVLGDSITDNLIRDLTGGFDSDKKAVGFLGKVIRAKMIGPLFDKSRKAALKVYDVSGKAYNMPDEFWKIVNFEGEKARLRAMLPNETAEQIEVRAAEIVRNTMPTYSRAPEWVKVLRKFPVMAPFITFPAEMVRITLGQGKIGLDFIREGKETGNKKMQQAGYARLLASGIVAGVVGSIPMIFKALSDVSTDDEDDLRKHLAPWEKNVTLLFLGRNEDDPSKINYLNLSFMNPYDIWLRPWRSFMRGMRDPNADGFGVTAEAAGELVDPIAKEQILFGSLVDTLRGVTATGRKVWDKTDSDFAKAVKSMTHVYNSALEPGTVTSIEKIVKAANSEVSVSGRAYNVWQETVSAGLGLKANTVDVNSTLAYAAKDFRGGRLDSISVFSRAFKSSGTQSDDEILDAYVETNDKLLRTYRELYEKTVGAVRLGAMTRQEAIQLLRAEDVPADVIGDIMNNRFRRYTPSPDSLQDARRKGEKLGQDRINLYRQALDRVPAVQQISEDTFF